MKPKIIGICGYAGAGKDKFASLLFEEMNKRSHAVRLISSGDLIRQYVSDNNLGDPGDRSLLRQVVVDVAQTHGYDFWLKQSIASAQDQDALLYPGLRQVIEVDFIHQHNGVVIGLDVPIEVRYERAQLRARPGDDISFDKFKENEEAERRGAGQQIEDVMQKADVLIVNDGTLEQLAAIAADIAARFDASLQARYIGSSY